MSTKKLGATVINIQPKVSRVLHGLIANGTKRPKNTREPAESDFIIQDFPTKPNQKAERDSVIREFSCRHPGLKPFPVFRDDPGAVRFLILLF